MVWLIIGLLIVCIIGIGVIFGGAPYVPTRRIWIEQAFELLELSNKDTIVDLGSGNGAVLGAALSKGVKRAVGYEINPILAIWSRWRLRKFGKRAQIKIADFFRRELPADTTVIYMFQVGWVLDRIRPYLENQKPKLRASKLKVVCFGFEIPDTKPEKKLNGMTLYEF